MSGEHEKYRLAREYFDAVSNGDLPDSLLTHDMTDWITNGGTLEKTRYQYLIKLLAAMCDGPLQFTINALIAQEKLTPLMEAAQAKITRQA